ncbi:MAG: rRNA maturation RNase YbeY, partial [Vulcanococcus sp.]
FAAQDDGLDDAPPIPMPDIDEEALELGDIVISLETAARQAPEHGHALAEELIFLATHGLLHLLGWDHPDDASLAAMLAKQQQLLGAPEQR